MEYEIPREACAEALVRVQHFVAQEDLKLSFPVEVRFTAPDDIPLSTGYGRPNAYIAVHVFHGMDYEPYFRGVERIMDDYGGRPHWGKLHFQTAETLRPALPGVGPLPGGAPPPRPRRPLRQPLHPHRPGLTAFERTDPLFARM